MSLGIELIVIEVITQALMQKVNPSIEQMARMVQSHPDYRGKARLESLEREIEKLLQEKEFQARLNAELQSFKSPEGNNVSIGFKLGRLEIKGTYKLP